MNDLLIKGASDNTFRNGYDDYHVRMGAGFIDSIEGGLTLKDPIENESRIEHGVRMLVSRKIAKRTLTLAFNIHGASRSAFMANKKAFETMLLGGMVDIKVNDPDHIEDVYHLVYTGRSVTYKHSYNGLFGVFTAQFTEPNPANRTATQNTKVRTI